MAKHKETLTVVVNGQAVEVTANEQAPIRTIISEALKDSGNVGQSPDNWELKDAGGTLLALDQKIAEFNFNQESRVFLSLKAGVAGD